MLRRGYISRCGALSIEPAKPGQVAPKVITVGVDPDRQGHESTGLEPPAKPLREGRQFGGVSSRLIPLVQLEVSGRAAARLRSFALATGWHRRPGAVHSPTRPVDRSRRNRRDRPRSPVPAPPRSDSRSPRRAASQAANRGLPPDSTRDRQMLDRPRTSATRLVATPNSAGRARPLDHRAWRFMQRTSQRSASSYMPARMARLAFPSQTRSSSGADRPACRGPGGRSRSGGDLLQLDMQTSQLDGLLGSPFAAVVQIRHRASIDRLASSMRPCNQ